MNHLINSENKVFDSDSNPKRSKNWAVYFCILALMIISQFSGCKTFQPTTLPPEGEATLTVKGFEVEDSGEPLPPQIIEWKPSGGKELSLDGEVTLIFDQAMDEKETSDAFNFFDETDNKVNGEIQWMDPQTMQFVAEKSLQLDQQYKVVIDVGAKSANGISIEETQQQLFRTASPLQVSQVFPADGAKDIASSALITAVFNRPVVQLSSASDQQDLPDPLDFDPPVSGLGQWVSTSTYTFQPGSPLKSGESYQVAVKAGLLDAAGQTQLNEDYIWGFSTQKAKVNSFELSNGTVNPEMNLPGVLLDEYFKINFNTPMDQSSTESALSLTPEGGQSISFLTEWNEIDTSLTITPTQRLELDSLYTLNLEDTAKAADGGQIENSLVWTFNTVPQPAVLYITPPEGAPVIGFTPALYVKFASPMDIESVKENLEVTPQPEQEIQWWYNPDDWSMSAYFLEPSTSYTVKAQAGMLDIYGNPTRNEHLVSFYNPEMPPQAGLQMPWEPALIRPDGPQEFYASFRNVNQLLFGLWRITPEQFVNMQNGTIDRYKYVPPDTDLVWETQLATRAKLNELALVPLYPVTESGEALPAGFYFLTLDTGQIPHDGQPYLDNRLIVVADANLTFKSTTLEGLLWLTGLASGEPIQGVEVEVYDKGFNLIAEGITDKDGLFKTDLPEPTEPYDPRYALAAAESGVFAFTSSQWGAGVNLYDYGMWGNYYAPANQPSVYVYTDRPIYRPDQPVYFKGILRIDDDLDYQLPEQDQVHVKINNFLETVYEKDLPLSKYGSFNGEFQLDPEAVLGAYEISAALTSKTDPVGAVSFTVAEYRRPEFQVKVNAEPENILVGENFDVEVLAEYYAGGAVSGADVIWTLNADPYYFTPPTEYSSYSFEVPVEDVTPFEEIPFEGSETIARGEGQTDVEGLFYVSLPGDLSDSGASRQLTFEATVSDIAKNAVSGRDVVIVHRSSVYPGVRPESYVGTAGDEAGFELVALDLNKDALPGQLLKVEIVERRWYSVQEQDASGNVRWVTTVEDVPVASQETTTNESGEAVVRFTPPVGGVYRAVVTAFDASGNEGKASGNLWVSGPEFIPWQQTNDRSFDLVADKKEYQVGETAEILIASPYQGESYALITVERGRIHHQEVQLLTSNSTIYRLPVTDDLAPNVFVSVLVITGIDETDPRPSFKMGVTKLLVNPTAQQVFLEVAAEPEQAGPGDMVTYTVQSQNDLGQPVQAELSLGLSDLATLSLMPPNSLPILDHFYSERILGVWTSVPIFLSLEEYNATIEERLAQGEGMGSGGGKGEGEFGVVVVRQDFPDTAFWEAQLETDKDGMAQVKVRLPDNLTTWRMDARAVTLETQVGQQTADLISTKPLLVRPQTPRFFTEGDSASIGTVVQNNTGSSLDATISLDAQGLSVESDTDIKVKIPAGNQAYAAWRVNADQAADRADLVFRVEGGGLTDASRPPQGSLEGQGIPIYRYSVRETSATSGVLIEAETRVEAVSLPPGVEDPQGELIVKIQPSLAAGMTDGLTYLEHYPYECVEQTISRFLPDIVTYQAFKTAGIPQPGTEADIKDQINSAIQKLIGWQNPDGGWSWWADSQQKSDPLTSAYAVLGLLEAEKAGFIDTSAVLDRAVNYLRMQIRPVSRLEEPDLLNRQAFLLYVLARAGKPNVSAGVQLYEQRQNLATYANAFLAQALYTADSEDERVNTLISDFTNSAITSATGTHWEEDRPDRFNWNTNTRTTAILLDALVQIDPTSTLIPNVVRWLMGSRTDGRWVGTQENAWAIMALTRWMESSSELETDYSFGLALNNQDLGGGQVDQSSLDQTWETRIDVAELLSDQANRLAIGRDTGPGNLYYSAFLDLAVPVEQAGVLEQGIAVSRKYYPLSEETPSDLEGVEPVTEVKQGELLMVRLTLVTPNDLHYVLVEDPLPAGLEAVDQSLLTSPQNERAPEQYNWENMINQGWGWWYFEHTQMRDEKLVLSASYLPAGTYIYTYLVRGSTPGTFKVIPPTAQEFYFPEVYGRGEGVEFVVTP